MKGLILKDFYQILKSYKILFLYFAVFFTLSFFTDNGTFFLVFPCIILGMMPVTLFSTDEKDGWCRYSATLPVSRAQYINAKYLVGMILAAASTLLCIAATVITGLIKGQLEAGSVLLPVGIAMVASLLGTGIAMPFSVKLGADKGRIALFIAMGVFSGGMALLSGALWEKISGLLTPNVWMVALAVLFAALYALSWFLSVRFYQKKEL